MAHAVELPYELIDAIIDAVPKDKSKKPSATLVSCNAVCSSWHMVTRPHLFRSVIVVDTSKTDRASQFLELVTLYPDILPLIHRFELKSALHTVLWLQTNGLKFDRVQEFVLCGVRLDGPLPSDTFSAPCFPSLVKLTIRGVLVHGFRELQDAISTSNISNLSLVSLRVAKLLPIEDRVRRRAPVATLFPPSDRLRELYVAGANWKQRSLSPILMWAVSSSTLRRVEFLKLGHNVCPIVSTFLRGVSKTLEHLVLEGDRTEDSTSDPPILSSLPIKAMNNLRSLTRRVPWVFRCWLPDRPTHLELIEFRLDDHWSSGWYISPEGFKRISVYIEAKSDLLLSLKCIKFSFNRTDEGNTDADDGLAKIYAGVAAIRAAFLTSTFKDLVEISIFGEIHSSG